MSEEIHNAPVGVPQSILFSILVNGALGFAMLISTLCVADDIQGELNPNLGYTWVAIFVNATGSVAGGATILCIVVIKELFCNVAILASFSRLVWAYAGPWDPSQGEPRRDPDRSDLRIGVMQTDSQP